MKSKIPLIQIVLLLLLLAGAMQLFFVTEKKIVDVNKKQIEVDQLAGNMQKLNDLDTTMPALTDEMANFLRTLPASEADVAEFATRVEQVARGFGMTITYQFDDFPKPVDISGQNMSGLSSVISLEGSFQGLTSFLTELSNLPYFFKIDKLTVVKHESKPVVKVTINGYLMMNLEKK